MCHMTRVSSSWTLFNKEEQITNSLTPIKNRKKEMSLTLNVWGGGCRYSGLTRRVGGVRNCSRKTRAENRICFSLGLDEWFT